MLSLNVRNTRNAIISLNVRNQGNKKNNLTFHSTNKIRTTYVMIGKSLPAHNEAITCYLMCLLMMAWLGTCCPMQSPATATSLDSINVTCSLALYRWTLMPFKNGNSSGWWVFIRRNASCCESPERNLQWRRPTWYMDTHSLKLTLRNTLVYPSINTHLGPHTSTPQPRRPMELEPSSSATYARRQLQWRCAHTNPSSAQSSNTPVWYGTPTQLKT